MALSSIWMAIAVRFLNGTIRKPWRRSSRFVPRCGTVFKLWMKLRIASTVRSANARSSVHRSTCSVIAM